MPTARKIPVFYIGKENTNILIKNFMANKYPALNTTLTQSKEDTQSIWYDMKHFEELYKELIYLNADGLRVYFGAYPEGTITDMGINISNQLCVVMVPTFLNKDDKHEDLILEETPIFEERQGCERYLGGATNNVFKVKGFDQGGPCKPCCDDQQFGYPY